MRVAAARAGGARVAGGRDPGARGAVAPGAAARRLPALVRRALAGLGVVALLAWSGALAATLTIDTGDDPNARLELRRTRLPSGAEVELIVLTGERVTLSVDDLIIVGGRIELDVDARLVRVIGPGSFTSGEERLEGEDLELRLDEERVRAVDAIVFTSAIDVSGDLAERLPGQLTFTEGLASPCSRCSQEVLDYAFRAASMTLFPGDRLVGHDVAVQVRGVTVLRLPVLVIPLAQGDRQPRLAIASGSAARRAEVSLRWPYVAGSDGIGTFTVRYLADVDPTADAGLAGRLLGGAVEVGYLGFELDHRLYDDVGSGTAFVAYEPPRAARPATPGFAAREPSDAEWTVRLAYAAEQVGAEPTMRFEVARADALTPGRWTYLASLGVSDPDAADGVGLRTRVDSQGFIDGDPGVDPRTPPPYADRRTPRVTGLQLRLDPLDLTRLQLWQLRVTSASLDLGIFEDAANPVNRRAAAFGIIADGRLALAHQVSLVPWTVWSGGRLEADNRFEGRYYGSAERAVQWRTRIAFGQAFGNFGSASLTFTRDVTEGETPFRFDAAVARSRSDVGFGVELRPVPWLSLRSDGGYVLVENRRPETVGWAPLTSRLTAFGNLAGVDASLEHRWPILDEDPGTLRASISLQGRRVAVDLRVGLEHLQDLYVEPAEPRVAETFTRFTWRAAYEGWVAVDLTATYRPEPAADASGRVRTVDPLDLRLELGNLRTGEARPGLRLQAQYDTELERFERLDVDLRARLGPVELEARERVTLPDTRVTEARLAVTWQGVARLEARGFEWLPPAVFGHEVEPRVRQLSVQLREERERAAGRWELGWRATLDPALEETGRRDTRFEARVSLLQENVGPWFVSVEGLGEWALADDRQPEAFLRRASLTFGADVAERFGVQGRLSYQATYDRLREELGRSELTIGELTVAVRPTDQLTLGARIQDVWEFTRSDPARSPWNFQPEVFFVWDRCCWALAGSWNAETGAVRLVLTGPGADNGLEQVLDTDWTLPRVALRGDAEQP
ncbi:MAG: hypothetical protein K0A98_00415 [Trueperaceae bacterium]|nr:hypothetical protein [Trueperaceae bacterium]